LRIDLVLVYPKQYRFDVAAQVLGGGRIKCTAPIREFRVTREFATKYLCERGAAVTEKQTS
jgi:argininosuccinate synthase